MRIIYFGTPDFAVLPLENICKNGYEVVACVTQPDKPRGRKAVMTPSDVKVAAEELGIPVLCYEKVRNHVEELRALNADIMVTCAYGQILSQAIIDIAPHGIINIHGSLLPKYRGAAPVQWTLINGEEKTGITIMKTEAGIDTGDIILVKEIPIEDSDTAETLFNKLSTLGAEAIIEALKLIENGTASYQKQDESKASYVKMLNKDDGKIDFGKSAKDVCNLVRGTNPWPGAYCDFGETHLKVWAAKPVECNIACIGKREGRILVADNKRGLIVACGQGEIEITELQAEGGKRMSAKAYLLGHSIEQEYDVE